MSFPVDGCSQQAWDTWSFKYSHESPTRQETHPSVLGKKQLAVVKQHKAAGRTNKLPVPTSRGRETRDTWSLKPSHERPGRQETHPFISVPDKERLTVVEKHKVTWGTKKFLPISRELFTALRNPLLLVDLYEERIQDHIAARVSALWGQFLVAHDERFSREFAANEKIKQFWRAPTFRAILGNERVEVPYQAAHSSTLPVLKVRELDEETPYSELLKDSHLDYLNNSTVGLPRFVNQVDSLIDSAATNPRGLRRDTIALINQVAEGILHPVEAMCQFLNCFAEKLVSRPSMSRTMTPEKAKVIEIYQKKVEEMRSLANISFDVQERHPFFDDLLSINLQKDDPQNIPLIRNILFDLKPGIIHEGWIVESEIQEMINNVAGNNHEDANFDPPLSDLSSK